MPILWLNEAREDETDDVWREQGKSNNTSNLGRMYVKPPKFDGRGCVESHLLQFQVAASRNRWNEEEKADFLKIIPRRLDLRSADSAKGRLVVPKTNTKTISRRAFAISCPLAWNRPDDLHDDSLSLMEFRKKLKTVLF